MNKNELIRKKKKELLNFAKECSIAVRKSWTKDKISETIIRELQEKNKEELLSIARKFEINVKKNWKKDKIINTIIEKYGEIPTQKATKVSEKEIFVPESQPASVPLVDVSSSSLTNMEGVKYEIGTTQVEVSEEEYPIPEKYGVDRLVLLYRDPEWVFTYWEITDKKIEKAKKILGSDFDRAKSCLRVYFTSESARTFFDVEIFLNAKNWYINIPQPDSEYYVELGFKTEDKFVPLLKSNSVKVPANTISDEIDEKWMTIESIFKNIYGVNIANLLSSQRGSVEIREIISKKLKEIVSVGASQMPASPSSFSYPKKDKKDKFWFVVNTELIVYGATEPDAKVFVQGESIKLRPDGTFTLRFALPDGKQIINCKAVSKNGKHEIEITPIIRKETK